MVFVPSLIAMQQHLSKAGSHCVPLTWILHGFLYPIQFNTKSWRGGSVEELEKGISDIQPFQLKVSKCFRTRSDLRHHFQLVLPMKTSACGGCFAPSHTVSWWAVMRTRLPNPHPEDSFAPLSDSSLYITLLLQKTSIIRIFTSQEKFEEDFCFFDMVFASLFYAI